MRIKTKLSEELPLECKYRNGALTIRIGEKVLAFATEQNPDLWDGEMDKPRFKVTDAKAFSREVMRAMNKEEEDGSTLLSRMIDQATLNAIDYGCEGVEEVSG
jgi:hypothetical protein